MTEVDRRPTILVAEDDPDDQLLATEALAHLSSSAELRFVGDGVELLDYLRRRGPFSGSGSAPRPSLVLLDLNMPRKDGREVLREIKADRGLRMIPVVVFTTSHSSRDIELTYELGGSGYITKPTSFERLVRVFQTLGDYWLDVVESPGAWLPRG